MKRIISLISISLLLLAVCLGTPYQAGAADPATDMAKMTEKMIQTQLNEGATLNTAEKLATFKRNLYDALIKKKFSSQEALQLVIYTPLPTATPSLK